MKIFRVTEPKKINRHYSDEQKRCSAVVHRVITPHHGDKLSPLTQPRARRINFMSKAGPSILCSVARCAKRIRRTNLQFPFRKHTAWGVVVLKCGGESPRMAGQGFRGGDEENTVFFSKLVMESHVTREVAHPLKPAVVHGPVLSTCTVSYQYPGMESKRLETSVTPAHPTPLTSSQVFSLNCPFFTPQSGHT